MSNYKFGWPSSFVFKCGNPLATIQFSGIGRTPERIEGVNITNASSGVANTVKKFYWYSIFPDTTFVMKTAAAGGADDSAKITSDGISFISTNVIANNLTGYTNADPAVLTVAGDISSITPGCMVDIRNYVGAYVADKGLPNGTYKVTAVSSGSITIDADFTNVAPFDSEGRGSVVLVQDAMGYPVLPESPEGVFNSMLTIGTAVQDADSDFIVYMS